MARVCQKMTHPLFIGLKLLSPFPSVAMSAMQFFTEYPESPPSPEYSITPLGLTLILVIEPSILPELSKILPRIE